MRCPTYVLVAFVALFALAPSGPAQCDQVWGNEWSNWTSYSGFTSPVYEIETADDFDVVGAIARVQMNGRSTAVFAAPILGATLRFYEGTSAGPGALQAEYTFAGDDPNFGYAPIPGKLDFRLPAPFAATGQHFVSAQIDFGDTFGNWSCWAANQANVVGSVPYERTNAGGWQPVKATFFGFTDLDFSLFDDDGTPPPEGFCGQWFEVASPNYLSDHNILRDLDVIAADDIWAIGESRLPVGTGWSNADIVGLAMHWNGTEWTIFPVPHPVPFTGFGWVDLEGIAAIAPDDVWASGSKRVVHPVDGFVGQQYFVIHWDGTSWTEVPTPSTPAGCTGAGLHGIKAFGPDDVWFAGYRCQAMGAGWVPATVLHWDGQGFTEYELPFVGLGGHAAEAIDGTGPDDVWVVGGPGSSPGAWQQSLIYHFDGTTWTHVPGPVEGLGQLLHDVAVIAPDDVWVAGEYVEPGVVAPLLQHWDGTSWETVFSPTGGAGIVALASDDVWTCGGGFAHWDGTEWTSVPALACTPGASLSAIDAVSPCELWAVGRRVSADLQSLTAHLVPSWDDAGGGLGAPSPQLRVGGSLTEGSLMRVEVYDAAASAQGLHIIGSSRVDLPVFPFFGGIMIPSPDVLVPFMTDVLGRHIVEFPVNVTLDPGLELYIQSWIVETQPKSVEGTNARWTFVN